MSKYSFSGQVFIFYSQLVERHWTGQTYAVSEAKAITNLKYQYRKANGLSMSTPVDLEGRLIKV